MTSYSFVKEHCSTLGIVPLVFVFPSRQSKPT
jgi:hypothetical protein